MLGIGFFMLKIDQLVSNLLPFFFAIFMWELLLGIDLCLILLLEGIFLMCPSTDAFNAMGNLVGSPPITVNETTLTLEHVMQRLEAIESKMSTIEHLENLDKKIHNHITHFGSKVGIALKTLKEKEPIVDERIEQSPARIDKIEEIINNPGSAFSSVKTIEKT